MEVFLPGFDYSITWYVALVQIIVAGVVSLLLRRITHLPMKEILKGAALFLVLSGTFTVFAMIWLADAYDIQVRVAALEALHYSYIQIDGNQWLGIRDGFYYRGLFEPTPPGEEVWLVRILPIGPEMLQLD
jgi:membrane protease YdiL (CAAX protease family)